MNPEELKTRFAQGKAFALPAYVVEPHLNAIRGLLGKNVRARILHVKEFKIDGYIFPGRIGRHIVAKTLFGHQAVLGDVDAYTFVRGTDGERILPVVIPKTSAVDLVDLEFVATDEKDPTADRKKTVAVMDAYFPLLTLFSQLTGWRIVFHMGSPAIREPFPAEARVMHLLPKASPRGENEAEYQSRLFSRNIDEKRRYACCRKPTRGRGFALNDPSGIPVVQIIEQTVYLLFPIVYFYYGDNSDYIFEKALALAWQGIHGQQLGKFKPYPHVTKCTPWAKSASRQVHDVPKWWEEKAASIDQEIADLQQKLRQKYRERVEVQSNVRTAAMANYDETAARLPKDWRRIAKHPLVERVSFCDEGLHIETKLVSITFEDNVYDVGRFIIRFGERGELSIWPIEVRHFAGVPHPHISKDGVACFGTAGDAIAKAAAEFRVADCIELLLRWLSGGYTPEIAAHKVEEWMNQATLHGPISILDPESGERREISRQQGAAE